ncbi:MAG: class C sortase [Defluviitaleaceae bacterium]|nr:class C sortase [Defluviitaleaceae bacterium]
MKRDILTSIALILLAVGSFVYPLIQQSRFEARAQVAIINFEARMDNYRWEHIERVIASDGDYIPLEDDPNFWLNFVIGGLSIANHLLYLGDQEHLLDPFNYGHPSFYMRPFGLDSSIIGILRLPSIDVSAPIYMGASAEHLLQGVAHLTHSSFPIGTENSNAVIAGHRNMAHSRVFRNLNQLNIGDEVIITSLIQTLVYTVIETRTVDSNQTSVLTIQPGRDLVTLVTTSSGRGNRRFIVVAERVE